MGQRADARIVDFMSKVRDHLKIEEAILFASRARGDELVDSDYDAAKGTQSFSRQAQGVRQLR